MSGAVAGSGSFGRVVRALRKEAEAGGPAVQTLRYTVEGPPVSWARARRRGRQHFTAPKQAAAKTSHNLLAAIALGGTRGRAAWPLDGAFAVEVWSYYPSAVVGDVDRAAGLPLDALEGLLWKQDRQVRSLVSHIIADGTRARTEVVVRRLATDPVQPKARAKAQR